MELEISRFKRVVVLTGAGISAESGIRTFRDSGGLWENFRIEDVATPEAFERDPLLVWRFYSQRRRDAFSVEPNAAHLALAAFQASATNRGASFQLITQNVDMLHERAEARTGTGSSNAEAAKTTKLRPSDAAPAGSQYLLPMHGTLGCSRCSECGQVYKDLTSWFSASGGPEIHLPEPQLLASFSPAFDCKKLEASRVKRAKTSQLPLSPCCQSLLRPHIVWFGEMPFRMEEIFAAVEECDLFVTIGTSGQVYPAAGLLEQAKKAGATTVCINKEKLPQQGMVDFYFEGSATTQVPGLFQI